MSQPPARPSVFISSTSIDLPEHRGQVVAACLGLGYFPVGMEYWPAEDADAEAVCLREVDAADIFVGLYAFRYGWKPAGSAVSICEIEHERARDGGKPRLLFFMDEEHPWPASRVDKGKDGELLAAFKQRLRSERVSSRSFTTANDLAGLLTQALVAHEQRHPRRSAADGATSSGAPGATAPTPAGPPPALIDCPYRDLRAFTDADAPFFFGREGFTRELLQAVDGSPFVAVVGASGSGKSSVVQAGLIPALRRRGGWAVGVLRPGEEPWRSLAGCLHDLAATGRADAAGSAGALRQLVIGQLADELAKGADGGKLALRHLLPDILAGQPGSRRLLLLVDQWEELYTYEKKDAAGDEISAPTAATAATAARFADALIAGTQQAPLTVVLTLRADFTHHAVDHRPLRDRLQAATVFLGGMTRSERERAIAGPAEVAGFAFEDGLVRRMLDDVGDEPGNLPLLEFCLTQLFAQRDAAGRMCHRAYDALGGVAGAIVRYADGVLDELAPGGAQQRHDLVRDVFLQLVQLGDNSEDTRRRARRGDFAAAAQPLIEQLASKRLLVVGNDPARGEETVEVAHEALIRRWPRLVDWLAENRADLHQRREIERAAQAWQTHGDSHRWSDERVMHETAPMLRRLGTRFALSENERRFLGPLAADELLARLADPATTHAERARIGDRLTLQPDGDPRPGVGLTADGVPDLVWQAIPGGEVVLEVDDAPPARPPRFKVQPFYMARYPITVAQWQAFVDADDGYDALVRRVRGWEPDWQRGRANQPAVSITWFEAIAYCRWLTRAVGHEVRLPTEWEWQQAATAGDAQRKHPWGEWRAGCANTVESQLGRMTAVGVYPAGESVHGVFDLAGNVWEWCLNAYDTPKDVSEDGDARRVVRGGSWLNLRGLARCAYRGPYHPGYRNLDLGVRVVCVSPILLNRCPPER
ncbi:SUMF1/EgtB/PvdO family nonheme iron enzyme [Accumulibacter sp.]|uniref:nSTAND1 domain-containing NTPase n=3 Tax=Accumulibacter sp. TaxID=2053492 RepID=UPI002D10DCEA|nr:SUMF1/EgtB/PvdO family nonheme iron enzyme [Accumulibacter sp.]HNE41269.1 SUMF1/EgtB/PvdO family nonheme iron enzyme [Accumulibacter sp.]